MYEHTDDGVMYTYRPFASSIFSPPETCDRPGCEQPATIEIVDTPHLFCSTACADRML